MFKLISLRASGFKRLDIEKKLYFPEGRLLVHGRNESGKSTLMEAIHYALYGMPLRPSKNASNEDIICYGRDRAIVELEFSIDDIEYQVRRELYKKKSNIHLLNKREKNGILNRITTGARNVNSELNEILHGIDSEALLNSCLVEQKELGKLEDANKQERIKAMSSILNLEAFLDARDTLKKEGRDLDKIHSRTLIELQKAEQANQDYDTAIRKQELAKKRITEIAKENIVVEEKLEEFRNQLEIIQQMKTHWTKINELHTELSGKQESLKLHKTALVEVDKAEKELRTIEEKIPGAEKNLTEMDTKIETIQRLNKLEENLRSTRAILETLEVRLSKAQQDFKDATEAIERTKKLDEEINKYRLVKAAAEKLEDITDLIHILTQSTYDKKRLENELDATKKRLEELKVSEELILNLEDQENQVKMKREYKQKLRSYGTTGVFSGIIIAGLMLIYTNYIISAIGAAIFVVGGYLYISNIPRNMEEELNQIRLQREEILGERARLRDHYKNKENLESKINEKKESQIQLEEQIIQELNQLPQEPREYKTVLNLGEPDTIRMLRNQIQKDTETFTRLITERESLQKKAENLRYIKETLDSIQKERETQSNKTKTVMNQITGIEQKTNITRKDEEEIRKKHMEANKTHTQLITKKNECEQDLERRSQIQQNINETSNEINLLEASIQSEEKNLKKLEEHGLSLGDEFTLNEERDINLRKSASLTIEKKERNKDISESSKIIKENEKLNEQYPTLVDESAREEFRLEAMRRSTILLDATRESIMSGVKQSVEKNMMQFLPTLTGNRYNMARIDETNYRIEVYDREAKTWRRKGVFSGATQDQFSLALRLAFAISTIPSSRGARPGFIFLDEPLIGFDIQRRNGFMQLLRDNLSHYFDQIIVISHLEVLAQDFQNSITLDSGKIIEVQR